MQNSELDRFLKVNHYWVKKTDGDRGTLTHTLMAGVHNSGCIRVGRGNTDDDKTGQSGFNYFYAKEVQNGTRMYIQEIRTPFFKYFLDLDILHTEAEITEEEYDALMQVINDTVKLFFPNANPSGRFMTLMLTTKSHPKHGHYKHGIHIIFPKIIVDSVCALLMREMLIEKCIRHFGDRFAKEGWCNVIDNSVYGSSNSANSGGLRLIFSRKAVKCKCGKNNKPDQECDLCDGHGYYEDGDDGRPYTLYKVYDDGKMSTTLTDYLAKNIFKLIDNASIRCKEEQTTITNGWKRCEGCPSYGDMKETKVGKVFSSRSKNFSKEDKTTRTWNRQGMILEKDLDKVKIIEHYIKIRLGYPEIRISSIQRDPNSTKYFMAVDGMKSNYCMNIRGDHNRNRIWFFADKLGISQKCFCRCDKLDGRYKGLCKDFRSPPKAFSDNEASILFPKMTNKKAPSYLAKNPVNFTLQLENELFGESQPPPPKRPRRDVSASDA
jgi:hypothetical protein